MNALIDSLFCASSDLNATAEPYERLGLPLSATAGDCRSLVVGEAPAYIHFLAGASCAPVLHPAVVRARLGTAGLFAIGLHVTDLAGEMTKLMSRGVPVVFLGSAFLRAAWLPIADQAGTDLVLLAASLTHAPAHNRFPIRRLDHVAAVTHDLDAKTRYWSEVLGLPATGEVKTPTMVIRQFRIGDAIIELLGPTGADSPIQQRKPGLISMASWEVADLEQSIAAARGAGFTVPDATAGVLPGTRITTIQGSELAGINMQLLQYVG